MDKRSIVLGVVIAAVVLVAAIGSASAQPCPAPGNTPIAASCWLTQNYNVPAGQAGYIIQANGVTIDGNGFTITGGATNANCEWADETNPCTVSGIYNAGFDNVEIKNLTIKDFCTGIALKGSGPNKIMGNTIDNCVIHDNGFNTMSGGSEMATHGVHACWLDGSASAPALTITNNEIYNNEGTGGGCGDGGNGIFIYGGSPDTKHEYCNISYNYLHHNAKAGFWTKMMLSKSEITHNKVTENGGGAGISDDVHGGIILRCKLSNDNLIAYNNASNNGGSGNYGYGIYIGGDYNIIRDNDEGNETFGGDPCGVNGNTADGISLGRSDGSSNNQILNNEVCSNHRYGVSDLTNKANCNNTIYYNYICYNWEKDVYDSTAGSYTGLTGDYNHGTTAYQYCDYHAVDCPDVPFWGDCGLVGPDLTVSDKHEEWIVEGSTYNIHYTITNVGTQASTKSNASVHINGVFMPPYDQVPALNPGVPFNKIRGPFTISGPGGIDTILVCADALAQVTETNENNNCTENKFGAADLVIHPLPDNYVEWVDLSWKTYNLKYQVENVGDIATPNDVRVNFTELWGDWKDCVYTVPIPAGLQPGETTGVLTAGPFVMGDDTDWLEEWVNFDYSCPVNHWNVLHHDRARFTEGYPEEGPCWDVNGVIAECGDVNCVGGVDMGDVVAVRNYFAIGLPVNCKWAANANCVGGVDMGDAVAVRNYFSIGLPLNCCEGCEDW